MLDPWDKRTGVSCSLEAFMGRKSGAPLLAGSAEDRVGVLCASTVGLTGDARVSCGWYPRPGIPNEHLRKARGADFISKWQ